MYFDALVASHGHCKI